MEGDKQSKNQVRVRYSGFIIFASQIISVFTGVAFLLMLTRISTSGVNEFGTWSFIPYLVALFAILNGVFPFWVTRFAARGREGSIKTGVVATFILALGLAGIYALSIIPIMSTFHVSSAYLFLYLLSALQLVDSYMIAIFEGSLRAVKPQALGYGLLVEEIVKISVAYVLIIVLKQYLVGAMVSLIVAATVQGIFYLFLLKDEFRQKINREYLREWLRGGSIAVVYNAGGAQLLGLVLYLLVYFSGQTALGYYQAAVTFSAVVSYAFSIAFALYPKMLAQDCPADVADSFKTMIMLALPIAAVIFTMARSLLTILKVDYAAAYPVLMVLTIDALVLLVSQFYIQCIMATDTIDIGGKIPINDLAKSKIFKIFTISYIQAAFALPALYFVLTGSIAADPILAATYLVGINLAVHAGTVVVMYGFAHKTVSLPLPWKSLGKYAFGALVTGLVLFVLPQTSTLLATFGKALAGVAVYTVLLVAIDMDARKLVRQIWEELAGNFR